MFILCLEIILLVYDGFDMCVHICVMYVSALSYFSGVFQESEVSTIHLVTSMLTLNIWLAMVNIHLKIIKLYNEYIVTFLFLCHNVWLVWRLTFGHAVRMAYRAHARSNEYVIHNCISFLALTMYYNSIWSLPANIQHLTWLCNRQYNDRYCKNVYSIRIYIEF